MTNLRKESSDRLQIPAREQSTLLPCPACKETGFKTEETETSYKKIKCNWCQGFGAITKKMFEAYKRIERLYHLHKSKGLL